MKLAWKWTAVLIVMASAVFSTGACGDAGGDKPGAAPTSTKPTDPKTALLNSLAEYDKGVFALDYVAFDNGGQGKVDSGKKHAYLKTTSTDPDAKFAMELLVLEPDAYLKMDMGELAQLPGLELLSGKKWMHIDRSKVPDSDSLTLKADGNDPIGLRALLQSSQSVQAAGDRRYSGTFDLSKGTDSPITDEDVIKALGDKAASVPFTVTLDGQGRLAELLVDVPAAGDKKAHQLKLTLSEYGAVTLPARPTGADVVEAPAKVYEVLGG